MLFAPKGCDYLIVGLGNPDKEYYHTRHNVGFRTVDALAEQLGTKINREKFRALVSPVVRYGDTRLMLVKPLTYMNSSGDAVKLAGAFYKVHPEHIIVFSDDVTLDVGTVRLRESGSAGGHNGLKSIIAQLGTEAFPRIKIGVGKKPHPDYDLADWVLGSFSKADEELLKPAMERAAEAALDLIRNGAQHAANRYNGK